MKPSETFQAEVASNIQSLAKDENAQDLTRAWLQGIAKHKYSYNFQWLGRPIIQFPQDILAMQEIIWEVKPDLIIETGVAHGGSLIFLASMLELNASCGGPSAAKVVGVDIDIRPHNRESIEAHPLFRRISLIEGSSIDSEVIDAIREHARGKNSILVSLDSNHTHEHVLAELEAYAPLVTIGSYCVVFDTLVEDMPAELSKDRPWGPGNNPKTAVWEYLKEHPEFEINPCIQNKLMITVAPDGYLRRVK